MKKCSRVSLIIARPVVTWFSFAVLPVFEGVVDGVGVVMG
jgi:hypothetical protein